MAQLPVAEKPAPGMLAWREKQVIPRVASGTRPVILRP